MLTLVVMTVSFGSPWLAAATVATLQISGAAWRLATEETHQILGRPRQLLFAPVLVQRATT